MHCVWGVNDGCALVGRHGRAHRHSPNQSPSYFSTQSHTNQITIYTQSTQTAPTVHTQSSQMTSTVPRVIHPNVTNCPHAICSNETVGAVPMCPPERPHSGVSIPTNTRIVRGELNDGCALVGRHGRAHRHRPYQSPLYIRVQSSPTTSTTQTKRVNNPHTHRGRKCIAHSRPHP